jgi:hypothetical protein
VSGKDTYRLWDDSLLAATTERSHVVNSEPSLLLQQGSVLAAIGHLRDAFERAVIGGLEVDRSGPVVA